MQGGRAVGIVTDRDLLTRVVARGLDPARTQVGEVMSTPLVFVSPRDSLERVITAMVERGIRRVPVLCGGRPTGIVALDDLVVAASSELSDLSRGIQRGSPSGPRATEAVQARQRLESRLARLDVEIERFGGGARDSLLRRLEVIRQHLRSDAP
jgi:signal-transduction protein with cAMP-binding, CBS, and nucleotidyltransferase domain